MAKTQGEHPAKYQKRYQLTWMESSRRWRKKYRGKVYYFPMKEDETKRSSYSRCIEEWRKKKAELDGTEYTKTQDYSVRSLLRQQYQQAQDVLSEHGVMLVANEEKEQLEEVEIPPHPRGPIWSMFQDLIDALDQQIDENAKGPKRLAELPSQLPVREPWNNPRNTSVSQIIKRFLERKNKEVERGKLSLDRYDKLRLGLQGNIKKDGNKERKGYVHFATGDVKEAVNASSLRAFAEYLHSEVDCQAISAQHADSLLRVAKQFARDCWENELIDSLPRNLKQLTISIPEKSIDVVTVGEVQTLIKESSARSQLYWLLMLNCGFGQADIAELSGEEVDWKAGTITRKRTKTKNESNVPTVCYILWEKTLDLLKEHGNRKGLVLTNEKGEPLMKKKRKGDRISKNDSIRSAFMRVREKLLKTEAIRPQLTLKHLRKTAASKLGEHPEYSRFAQYFLGHSPRTVADRHYIKPSQEQFDKAVSWLGEQFLQQTKN